MKSQISFEFVMIFVLVLAIISGFTYIINRQMQEISEKQEYLIMKNLAESIVNEVVLASSFSNNYIRKFEVPAKLFGQDYNISIEGEYIKINVLENNRPRLEYLAALPVYVKGTFVDEINSTNNKHCITKNNLDGIRISQNQASLDVLSPEVQKGNTFYVYISLHCLEQVASFSITIQYDPDKLEFIGAKPMIRDDEFRDQNPLFSDVLLMLNYDNSDTPNNPSIGRYNFGFLGKECETGSGNVGRLEFKVKNNVQLGKTEIKFDDRKEDNLKILDCTYTENKKALPDTKKNAVIEITN